MKIVTVIMLALAIIGNSIGLTQNLAHENISQGICNISLIALFNVALLKCLRIIG